MFINLGCRTRWRAATTGRATILSLPSDQRRNIRCNFRFNSTQNIRHRPWLNPARSVRSTFLSYQYKTNPTGCPAWAAMPDWKYSECRIGNNSTSGRIWCHLWSRREQRSRSDKWIRPEQCRSQQLQQQYREKWFNITNNTIESFNRFLTCISTNILGWK